MTLDAINLDLDEQVREVWIQQREVWCRMSRFGYSAGSLNLVGQIWRDNDFKYELLIVIKLIFMLSK